MGELNGCAYYMKVIINEDPFYIKLQERSCYFTVKI